MTTNVFPSVMPLKGNSLLPDFDPWLEVVADYGNGYETLGDTYARLAAGAPIAQASGTVTVATAGTAGDTFTVTVKNRSVTVVSAGGGDAADAVLIAAAINADQVLARLVIATSAAEVVTIRAKYPGIIPNGWALTATETGATGNVTAGAANLANGLGNFITALENIAVQVDKDTLFLWANRPVGRTVELAAALANSNWLFS